MAIIPYPNGTYHGEWIEGHLVGSNLAKVRHGKGKMRYFNGNEYTGDFLRDCFNGSGQYTWADGRVFRGNFKDDKINGEGVGEWPDGRRYEGEYVNDRAEGHGVVTLPDGRLFEGRRDAHFKTRGLPSLFNQINQGVDGHTTRAPPGYHTTEQVSNPEPLDYGPCVLTTTLLAGVITDAAVAPSVHFTCRQGVRAATRRRRAL